jgi:serine/threonine-protein kinase HipA
MLYLVGVNSGFDSQKALREHRAARLVRLAQGVYCEDGDLENLPAFMRRYAVRIASYLFPDAILTQASAYYKAPLEAEGSTADDPKYRLHIAGKYTRTVNLRYLQIVQGESLKENDRVKRGCMSITDGEEELLGPIKMLCAMDELVFLQNFGRRRANLERFLSDETLLDLRKSLEAQHGKDDLPVRLRAMADMTQGYSDELDRALAYLRTPIEKLGKDEPMTNLFDYTVGWFNRPIARLTHNGMVWRFDYNDGWLLPLSVQSTGHGQIPQFIPNLFAEGYTSELLASRITGGASAFATTLACSERYLSHIAIVDNPERLKELPLDVLAGRLDQYCDGDWVFTGRLAGVPTLNLNPNFSHELNDIICSRATPRISGTQAKIPMYLDQEGVLWPASNRPFTHILKMPGMANDPTCSRGGVEWASMELARAAGVKTADFALLEWPAPDNSPSLLCYITERFDVPISDEDGRSLMAEDVCSAAGLPPATKYGLGGAGNSGSIEFVANLVKSASTKPEADAEDLFRQVFASFLLENGDLHLKNFVLLKIANRVLDKFISVRLAPAFDVMCTAPFSVYKTDVQTRAETPALTINNQDEQPSRDDFLALAKTMGLDPAAAEAMMDGAASAISAIAKRMANNLPEVFDRYPQVREQVTHVLERATWRCHEWNRELEPGLDEPAVKKSPGLRVA